MCHTKSMKKLFLLFVPVLFSLVACDEITFGYNENAHSAGIEGSINNSQFQVGDYSYFSGDQINFIDYKSIKFSFDVSKSDSNISKENLASIIQCDDSSSEYVIQDAMYVGVKKDTSLFIGVDSNYADGRLSILFDKVIKAVEIKARRYYSISTAWNEENVIVDSNVAIAVNDSKYIKLTNDKDTNGIPNITECCYLVPNNRNEITIKVGSKRAFIEEIVFYY